MYGEVVRAAVVVATVRLLSVAVSRVLTRSSLYSGCAVRTQRHYASPSAAREFFWTGKPGG